MTKLAAVVSASGLGDGLMMMVASHLLYNQGYTVTTFHDQLGEMKSWFPAHSFATLPSLEQCQETFSLFDLIILQYDHHRLLTKSLIALYKRGIIKNLSVFYPSKTSALREVVTGWDQVFYEHKSMVENIAYAISSLFQLNKTSKNNGLVPPVYLKHQKYLKRVVIHPTKDSMQQRWPQAKFLILAEKLQNLGLEVVFCVAAEERLFWTCAEKRGFLLPLFPSLYELSSYIFESLLLIGNDSGLGHLASNLQIPTVIIANCYKRMKLWNPGWLQGSVLTPSRWIPNPKGLRIREKYWDRFISPKHVLRSCLKWIKK